jgi:TatD DNase family protein
MELFDSHCHLNDPIFDGERVAVLERANKAGVAALMIAGVDLQSSRRAVALGERFSGVYAAVGVHPHDARNCSESALASLRALASSSPVRAWGEIGLDFNRMYSPRRRQETWFRHQLEMADAAGLPIILHERDSSGRLLEMLAAHPNPRRRGTVHCFSGSRSELDRYLEMGFYIGVTGVVTMEVRGAGLRRLIPLIPSSRLLVETDAPYLTPAPHKNKTRRNEPAFVRSVLLKVASLRGEDPTETAATVWRNACRLFDIDPQRELPPPVSA